MPKDYPTTGISFPDQSLLDAARAKAKSQKRSLSNYINNLVEEDLASDEIALRDASSAKIQEAKDARIDSANYKIRSRRKPSS